MLETIQPIPLTDLRIGNYIYVDNALYPETGRQHQVEKEDFVELIEGKFKGILLTEEWLEKLGFVLREIYLLYMIPNSDSIGLKRYYNGSLVICVEYEDSYGYSNYTETGKHITTVHELQNAFYWFTGTELTLKQ